jgi:hypothetical protein
LTQPRHFHLGSFRVWFSAAKGVTLLMPLPLALFLVPLGNAGDRSIATGIARAAFTLLVAAAAVGASLCLLMFFGEVRMRCPFCKGYGTLGGDKPRGPFLDCDKCGIIHAPGFLGWKLVKPVLPSTVTASWIEDPTVPLVLDLTSHRLSGVGIGGRMSALSFLGQARDRQGIESWYEFPSKGLCVEAIAGIIQAIHVSLAPDEEDGMIAFPGTFRHAGNTLPAGTLANEEAIIARFGRPQQREEELEGDAVTLIFRFGMLKWAVELAGHEAYCLTLSARESDDAACQTDDGVARLAPPK